MEEHQTTVLLRYRNSLKELSDELTPTDSDWSLCRRTGRSYWELRQLTVEVEGHPRAFLKALGYSTGTLSHLAKIDDGWWLTFNSWVRMFLPQYEEGFRKAVSTDLTTLPDPEAALQAMATALNVDPSILRHFAENKDKIEEFLATQRATLGTLAELKLWELLMAGDAATVRWALPRLKSTQFGDQIAAGNKEEAKPKTITIIDV